MSLPNSGQNSKRVAINTVTLANMVALATRAMMQANTPSVSGSMNGENLTVSAVSAMAEATIRERLLRAIA